MARRKPRLSDRPHPYGWVETRETRVNGRIVVAGTEVKLKGRPGRFRFVKHVLTPAGVTWLDFIGGKTGHTQWVSVREDAVQTVHRINRTRANTT
ncbi:MAG: hypothetical protein QG661_3224 [Actinomycetota bacterium]|jgi:hypothetical protein|nr:hypothetical protein [Actinomycetota bacterium]MDQ5976015.1 hypothetical protein [Actinomycetota bacterium]